ncbi:MAG: hypothetical protein HWQ38_03570 [Nostoc sp. NMS7]|nr:hypothetical protein [Nostoc sp. NMS7]MBN3945606.1 hypothetical protein [Nostoc sp. NMS7]
MPNTSLREAAPTTSLLRPFDVGSGQASSVQVSTSAQCPMRFDQKFL